MKLPILLLLLTVAAYSAPVLLPDGVDLSTTDPGINATVYAIPGSVWLVGWNDNPAPPDYDFNDFMYTLSFVPGHGIAAFYGATSAVYNRAYVSSDMLEITRTSPLSFDTTDNAPVDFTLMTGTYRYDSANHGGYMWAQQIGESSTPEPSTALMVLCSLGLIGLAWRRA
jgi:hypothetical protein